MPEELDRAALAAQALVQAKAAARAAGSLPPSAGQRSSQRKKAGIGPSAGAILAPRRARRDDPAPLRAAIDGLVDDSGWEQSVAAGSMFGRWPQIVGADLAEHTSPVRLADGELVVDADSTAWATQLRLLAGELVRRLNLELGDNTVRRVHVRGPGTAPRQPGQWRVKGSRGPRDTYG